MRSYTYKIQWLFNISANFITSHTQLKRDLYSVIRILGAKSFTKICFRDSDLKIVHTYSSMNMYSTEQATKETIKYIKKYIKNNTNVYSVELYRR